MYGYESSTIPTYDWPTSKQEFDLDRLDIDVGEYEESNKGFLSTLYINSWDNWAPERQPQLIPYTRTVYNLEVEDNNTYYAEDILVHGVGITNPRG